MKEFLIVFASFLFVGLVNSFAIQSDELQNASAANASDGKLIFAHVIYRHGARNIQKQYPNDPFRDEKHWPEGLGGLTRDGKRQGFDLGKYFRRRYKEILGDRYSANDIYVQSTDVDRAIMSAQTNLAALFVPTYDEVWDDSLRDWQPVPVHTIPAKFDYTLYGKRACPRYRKVFKRYARKSDEVQKILKDNKDLFAYWADKCGARIKTIKHVYKLHKTLTIERAQKKDIPNWAREAIEPGSPMDRIALYHYKMATATKSLARMKSGFLLKEMLEHFDEKVNKKISQSLWLYSCHESSLANMLNSLGLFKSHFPPYTASVHFELYKYDEKRYYVQIFYRKDGEDHPPALEIPHCGKKCDLDKFYDLYKDIIPKDYDSECSRDYDKQPFTVGEKSDDENDGIYEEDDEIDDEDDDFDDDDA